jgi:hypothetical protein
MGKVRELLVEKGEVACQEGVAVTLDRCRFCTHSKAFRLAGIWITSPARAYCLRSTVVKEVNLDRVEAVRCDDDGTDGYRSIMNIIS